MVEPLNASTVVAELDFLHQELTESFRSNHWPEVSARLDRVAKIAEFEGRRELCLRAQSLREIMGNRPAQPSDRVNELFTDLLFQVSHLKWVAQSRL